MSSDPDEYDETVSFSDDHRRVDGHTFLDGYEAHDIAETQVITHLSHVGLDVEAWGIDMRHDNSVLGDSKMDLKAFDGDALAALIEIKTKRNPDWYGVLNRQHFRKYLVHAHDHDVFTGIYMSLLDEANERLIRDAIIPIQEWDELTRVREGAYDFYTDAETFLKEQVDKHPQVERTFRAPDGRQVVKLDLDTAVAWPTLTYRLFN